MMKILVQHGTSETATTKEGLNKAGNELVKQGMLISNSLFKDMQECHPEYKDGEILFANLTQWEKSRISVKTQKNDQEWTIS